MISKSHDQEWGYNSSDIDDHAVFKALGNADALGDQQGRRPGDEAIKAHGLEEIEKDQHDRALEVAGREDLEDAAFARILIMGRFRSRQWTPRFGFCPRLDFCHYPLGLFDPPLLRKPARAF